MQQLMCRESGRRIEPGSYIFIALTTEGESLGAISSRIVGSLLREEMGILRATNGDGLNIYSGQCKSPETKLYFVRHLALGSFLFSLSRVTAEKRLPNLTKGVFPTGETRPVPSKPKNDAHSTEALAV